MNIGVGNECAGGDRARGQAGFGTVRAGRGRVHCDRTGEGQVGVLHKEEGLEVVFDGSGDEGAGRGIDKSDVARIAADGRAAPRREGEGDGQSNQMDLACSHANSLFKHMFEIQVCFGKHAPVL